jgi:hypothetical protein
MMDNDTKSVAVQLHDWFGSILRLIDESRFSIVPEGPHRDAVVLDVLRMYARVISQSELDTEGKLYSPLCYFLAAARRKLGASLGVGHWRAALDNVIHLHEHLMSAGAEFATIGLEIGSPAALFKQELDEVISQASLAGGVSYLNKENREVALGLAINWGMRLLLAYALECPINSSNRKDLAWISSLMAPLLAASGASR